jgi:WD40 repeat protein
LSRSTGHGGWVRCVAVEPGNEWFCTGSQDRIIKIWDMASGVVIFLQDITDGLFALSNKTLLSGMSIFHECIATGVLYTFFKEKYFIEFLPIKLLLKIYQPFLV